MIRLFSILLALLGQILLSIAMLNEVTASTEKGQIKNTYLPPLLHQPLEIISTRSVVTNHHNVEPLDDTFCVCDDTGRRLTCSGVEKPTHIQCHPDRDAILEMQPDAITIVNSRAVRCLDNTEKKGCATDNEIEITGVFSHQDIQVNERSLCTANLCDLAMIAIKQEPFEIPLPPPSIEYKSQKSSRRTCPGYKVDFKAACGCGKNFNTASQLMSHRRSSSESLCKGDWNTTCGCGKNFNTINQFKAHRKSSSESLCKGDWNTTCGCGKNFDTVNQLHAHRKSSSESLCKGDLNTTCGCGKNFNAVIQLVAHRKSSSESSCKGVWNTTCGCGKNFDTVYQLLAHRQSSSDNLCKGRQNTNCGCGKNFDTASQLMSHRKSSRESLCKGDWNTTCGCGKNFETVYQLLAHRRSSSESFCRGDLKTTCVCGKNFDTANQLIAHRKSSSDSLCKGSKSTTCGCGKNFDTVYQLVAHRKSSSDTRCKSKRSKQKGGVNTHNVSLPCGDTLTRYAASPCSPMADSSPAPTMKP